MFEAAASIQRSERGFRPRCSCPSVGSGRFASRCECGAASSVLVEGEAVDHQGKAEEVEGLALVSQQKERR